MYIYIYELKHIYNNYSKMHIINMYVFWYYMYTNNIATFLFPICVYMVHIYIILYTNK